jgi:hypothetical protein
MMRNTPQARFNLLLYITLGIITLIPAIPHAESLVLQPGPDGKDAGVCSLFGWNSMNFGGDEWYNAIGLVSNAAAFIEFDLSEIPEGSTVNSATITLWAEYRESQVYFRPVAAEWDEMTITWDNQPSTSVPEISYPVSTCTSGCSVEFDITGIVRYWLENPNYGLKVVADSPNLGWMMASSDNLTKPKPTLTVEYSLVAVDESSWGAIKNLYR